MCLVHVHVATEESINEIKICRRLSQFLRPKSSPGSVAKSILKFSLSKPEIKRSHQ